MRFLVSILLQGVAVYLLARLMDGVSVGNYTDALLAAIVLAIANHFVKPILVLFTLPITILTLGLFLLLINGLVVLLVDAVLTGFSVQNIFSAIIFSILFSILNYFLMSYNKKVL